MPEPIERLNEALRGRYAIERELGAGGMATVYLAQDERHHRPVAIKVLKPELAAVLGAERFLSEIKTTANLQHPHILPLHDSGEADGFLFYVMPYVEGESLRERLDRETQLPIDEAVSITRKVASALQAAHDQGVVHRDIKPANILLSGGEPLIADFGIALAVQEAGGGRLTETGLSLGTPHYMSPEQATAERAPDARSDVYSLGCVLYEMLTGEPPFTGPSAQAVIARLLSADPAPITDLRKTVPPHVAAATLTALEKLPADRFKSTADLAAALADETSAPTRTFAAGGRGGTGRASGRWVGVLPWAIAAVAVLALVASLVSRPSATADSRGHRSVRIALPPLDPPLRGSFDLSRDGSRIVYVGGRPLEPNRLWVRSLGDPEIRALPGTENPEEVAVSWDGRWAAFWADSAIRKVSLDGGSPLVAVRTPDLPRGITWTATGDLVLGMLSGPDENSGLTLLRDAPGAAIESLTVADRMHHWPVMVDDEVALFTDMPARIAVASLETGRWAPLGLRGSPIGIAGNILFFRTGALRSRNLMAIRWDAAGRTTIGEAIPVPGIPPDLDDAALAADGTLVFTRSIDNYELILVSESGAVEPLQPGETMSEVFPRFSPEGGVVAMGADFRGTRELWLYDLAGSTLSALNIGFDPHSVAWTADGDRVLAAPSRLQEIRSKPADASEETTTFVVLPDTLTRGRGIQGVAVSPDARTLAIVRNVSQVFGASTFDIALVRLDDMETEIPLATGPADQRFPAFSPDGRWIAYSSNESGQYEVHVRQVAANGARQQISSGGGWQPAWAGEGGRLFYWVGDRLVAVDVSEGADSGRLTVGPERTIFQGEAFLGAGVGVTRTYDVSPDGRSVILARPVGDRGEMNVWLDWIHEIEPLFPEPDR